MHISSVWLPKQLGGAEKSAALLAESQVGLGHSVFAASSTDAVAEEHGHLNGVVVFRIPHHNLFWQEDWRAQSAIKRVAAKAWEGLNHNCAKAFASVMDRCVPDVVHTHSLVALTPLVWSEAANRGLPVVHTLRDFDLMCTRSMCVRDGRFCATRCTSCRVLTASKSRLYRHVDAVVGISADILSRHVSEGYFTHLPANRQFVVSNSVEREVAFEAQKRSGLITFGFLGRISPEKGLDILMKACRQLPAGGWQLLIGGHKPDDLSSFLPDTGNGMPVQWLGWSEVDSFLDRLDVLVVPSIWPEPFGRVTVEAFARRVPVLGSDIGGTPELIGRENRDWLFIPNDPTALAHAMLKVIERDRPLSSLIQQMDSILEETEPTAVAHKYLAIYQQLFDSAKMRV